ncbi:MAG: hypothetical protein A3K19_02315 [Lentisphaerae bacterium RIFOXYB12_FULL_65_16]|nr:MAG: hypothetical protein A3K18_29765 [Lentisphaerae bacterium RIFOXYA12_64_32]OGV86740.1 MAG: hypothetical protein A3K19_02315 [Lentisphaerae bacterium RIFOXYB12_FULL_65_16]
MTVGQRLVNTAIPLMAMAWCLCLAGTAFAVTPAFKADCEALVRSPHRLAGSEECLAASDYVQKRLTEIGVDQLIVQPFPTAQTQAKRCELLVDGVAKPFALLPMRPDGIIPPVSPPEGLTGPIVHAKTGRAMDLWDTSVKDAIVVMDYNCGDGWLRAFRLGARAIVFTLEGDAFANNPHFIETNANLPRFFYSGPASDLKEGATATVHSEVVWEGRTARNIIGFLKGTAPIFSQEKEELIILGAALDSFGEVPNLAPGARGAANCAALLELAEYFQKVRPRRHVLLIFFDQEARGHAGSSVFYRALETKTENVKVEKRQKYLDAEKTFLEELTALLQDPNPLLQSSSVRRQLINRLADRAAEPAYMISDTMCELRWEFLELKDGKPRGGGLPRPRPPDPKGRMDEISQQLRDRWQPERDDWNSLRRVLGRARRSGGRDETSGLSEGARQKLGTIMDLVREDVRLRSQELALEEQTLKADTALFGLIGEYWISLHISLMLGDSTPTWGLIIGGDSAMHSSQDNPGLYGKIQTVFLRGYQAMDAAKIAPKHFLTASADQTLSQTRVLWGAPYLVHTGEVAGLFGIYNICLGTCQESLPREGTPHDTLDRLNLDRIEGQVNEIASLLSAVADLETAKEAEKNAAPETEAPAAKPDQGAERSATAPGATAAAGAAPASKDDIYAVASQEGLSLRRGIVANAEYTVSGFEDESPIGPMVMGVLPGSSIPNTPMAGAVVQFRLRRPNLFCYSLRKPYAFDDFQVLWTTRNGGYALGPVSGGWSWNARSAFAAAFDERGLATSVSDVESNKTYRWRLNVFRCRAGVVCLPPQVRTEKMAGQEVQVMSSRSNAILDVKKSYVETADGVVAWFSDVREKSLKLFSLRQMVGLNNGAEFLVPGDKVSNPNGDGFSMMTAWEPPNSAERSSADLWRLNESRLQILRSKRILDSSLAELHGRAEDLLIEARDEPSPFRREALSAIAFLASQPLYTKIRAMLDDLVFAVIILLGLCVPFAFALERVVIGSTIVYRQIAWFTVIFLATFLTLRLSHPAFAIANTPIIIFLGFAIVVMSAMVIFIIMRKFEFELKALQGMTTTVHATDVSKISTIMAAMHMGISTMRRRPLKTALAAVTIILLTFTILCFASFGTQSGIVTLLSGPNPAYFGVWVHNVNWEPLSPDLGDVLYARWKDRIKVYPRYWISPKTQDKPGMLVSREDGSKPVTIRGVLGIDPTEIDCRPDLKELLDRDLDGKVLITGAVARTLEVEPGDTVLVGGRPLRVGKLLDAVQMSAARDMDTSSVLPADFTEASSAQQTTQTNEQEAMMVEKNWASLPVDSVCIITADNAASLGAELYGLQLYTRDTSESVDIAEDIARMLPVPVAATRTNGVYRHVLGTVLAASGIRDLFFPILLGGLVIFGTMLGSVADREREIYTFSALGLAPKHVATLFFAESMVYSLIGGMGGYLLAQGSLKVLTLLSEYGLVRVPEMNMSSTNTIFTILVVMATVLVSAIYPAIKASKSANPGLLRVWRPPEPKGDVLDLVFPFTVSEYDITGMVSFLREHFRNHTDTGLGQFMTSRAELAQEADGSLGLDATLALAPFDLGVSQSFALRSTPSEIPGINEVRVVINRKSGQPKDWSRLNKVFMDDLRQQFLLWRSIPHETMELYRERTLAEMGKAEVPTTGDK